MGLYCEIESLETESDVEQKFIYPMLTSEKPMGFGFSDNQVYTKKVIKPQFIGKGQNQKYYIPDYLISIRGIPVCIIEAKNPKVDLIDAYSEARLYATVVNSKYAHNINCCQLIIACNGNETWAGYYDQAQPEVKLKFDEFEIEHKDFEKLMDLCSKQKLTNIANSIYSRLRNNAKYITPVSFLGGKRAQNETIEDNTFGRTFIFENRSIFDPQSEEDRTAIVDNAYIKSSKREQHIDPIYKEIRKFELPNSTEYTPIATNNPTELVQRISTGVEEKNRSYSMMLLVGNVGSGKTTFVRYFKRRFLEKENPDLARKCDWIFLDMNKAPINRDIIYEWLPPLVIEQLKCNHQNLDFDSIEIIKKIFRKDVSSFEKGVGSLLKGTDQYNIKLFDLLSENVKNINLYLSCLIGFIKEVSGKIPIIVLDNCDKRNREEQLLMFDVAQWLRESFKCLIILPMRDGTYDQYRNEPPLDTVVKDLVFRIDPPDLLKVLQARLDYIVRNTDLESETYVLENGANVQIKKSDLINYFKCVLIVIRNSSFAREIFFKLSDRNTRDGIQIFEDFCKSGHVKSSDFLSIRALGEDYELSPHVFLTALLRKNRKYYNGDESNIVNLFGSDFNDDFPDPFIRIDILKWFVRQSNEVHKEKDGWFVVSEITKDMELIGHNAKIINREIDYLIKRNLLLCDNFNNSAETDDCIKITLSGRLHLSLLCNVGYIAACAENINFRNNEVMMSISHRLSSPNYLSKSSVYLSAKESVKYLISYRDYFIQCGCSSALVTKELSIYDLSDCELALKQWCENDQAIKELDLCSEKYRKGVVIEAVVQAKEKHFLICSFDEEFNLKGYLSTSKKEYDLTEDIFEQIDVGMIVKCNIIEFDVTYSSYHLRFVELEN